MVTNTDHQRPLQLFGKPRTLRQQPAVLQMNDIRLLTTDVTQHGLHHDPTPDRQGIPRDTMQTHALQQRLIERTKPSADQSRIDFLPFQPPGQTQRLQRGPAKRDFAIQQKYTLQLVSHRSSTSENTWACQNFIHQNGLSNVIRISQRLKNCFGGCMLHCGYWNSLGICF